MYKSKKEVFYMLDLDHVVLTGENIEELSKQYGTDFSVKSIKGDDHEEWGTYNYLAHFSNNCYVEWLGIRDIRFAKQLNHPLIQHLVYNLQHRYQGPFQLALRTDKLDQYVTHFEKKNLPYVGPFVGKRRKPDGQLLTWRMLFPKYDYTNRETLRFLIEWYQPEHELVDVSLVNQQAISNIHFGGITKKRFTEIYNLPNQKILRNKVNLRNTKIHFHQD